MAKNSFVLYDNWGTMIEALPDEMAGRAFKALFEYRSTGDVIEEDPALCAILALFIKKMEEDAIEYEKTCERNRKNAKKSASGSDSERLGATGSDSEPVEADTDTDTDTDTGTEKRVRARAKRPTVEEVKAYCEERGNKVDPEAFVAYYDSQNWKKANGQALANWKSAVVTWEKRDREKEQTRNKAAPVKKNAFTAFEQRDYDFDALEKAVLA